MKLLVIGMGQCGGRIADQFARMGRRARRERGIEVITGVYAVNTDVADLSGLSHIKHDYQHRIIIGGRKTSGHGVGKINDLASEIAKEDADKVIDAIRKAKRFFESDAFLLVASTAGGTGSGSIPVISQALKNRYVDKPVYTLLVLPFEHEENTEVRTIYNTATCLKSVSSVADAVFLIDNQRYIKKDHTLRNNIYRINELIAEPFYDLLCAGEEKRTKYIGSRLIDAGDIIQTLSGWSVLGYGKSQLPLFRLPFVQKVDFRKKSNETHKGIQTMDAAISELSLECNPNDSSKALYLLAAPEREMNMDLVKELGDSLRNIAPEALIRYGDYPRRGSLLTVTVILSQLREVDKVKNYYSAFSDITMRNEKVENEIEAGAEKLADASAAVPSLL
jgi:cell division GTPase FtsZ